MIKSCQCNNNLYNKLYLFSNIVHSILWRNYNVVNLNATYFKLFLKIINVYNYILKNTCKQNFVNIIFSNFVIIIISRSYLCGLDWFYVVWTGFMWFGLVLCGLDWFYVVWTGFSLGRLTFFKFSCHLLDQEIFYCNKIAIQYMSDIPKGPTI